MCEHCNIFFCGSCVLSSNGKCPACGKVLRSPDAIVPFGLDADEIYRHEGSPKIIDTVSALYIEPERVMRKLKQHSYIINGVINIAIIYFFLTVLRILITFLAVLFLTPGGTGLHSLSDPVFVFAFVMSIIYGFGISVVLWLGLSAILYIPAKFLEGKGTFSDQATLLSYAVIAVMPLYVFTFALFMMPYAGFFLGILGVLAVTAYAAFLVILIIREIHGFDMLKAATSLSVSIFIIIILAGVVLVLFLMPLVDELGKLLSQSV